MSSRKGWISGGRNWCRWPSRSRVSPITAENSSRRARAKSSSSEVQDREDMEYHSRIRCHDRGLNDLRHAVEKNRCEVICGGDRLPGARCPPKFVHEVQQERHLAPVRTPSLFHRGQYCYTPAIRRQTTDPPSLGAIRTRGFCHEPVAVDTRRRRTLRCSPASSLLAFACLGTDVGRGPENHLAVSMAGGDCRPRDNAA